MIQSFMFSLIFRVTGPKVYEVSGGWTLIQGRSRQVSNTSYHVGTDDPSELLMCSNNGVNTFNCWT